MEKIPYAKHSIIDEDIKAVIGVLKSNYLTQGPKITEFEKEFSKYIGSKYAVAVSNGTAALHLSALSMDIKSGDRIITTPLTFVASANCVRYCGGDVSFVDIDEESYLIDYDLLRKKLEQKPKGYYKGIITVNFAGRVIDLVKFNELADEIHPACPIAMNRRNEEISARGGRATQHGYSWGIVRLPIHP